MGKNCWGKKTSIFTDYNPWKNAVFNFHMRVWAKLDSWKKSCLVADGLAATHRYIWVLHATCKSTRTESSPCSPAGATTITEFLQQDFPPSAEQPQGAFH